MMNSNLKRILCCFLQGIICASVFATVRIEWIKFEEEPLKISVQWFNQPVAGAEICLWGNSKDAIAVPTVSDKNGLAEIKLPQKKTCLFSKNNTMNCKLRIRYKPRLQPVYETVDSTINIQIRYNKDAISPEIKIDLLPNINIKQSQLYLTTLRDNIARYHVQMNRYTQRYVNETDSIFNLSKLKLDLMPSAREFQLLSLSLAATKEGLKTTQQNILDTKKLIDNVQYFYQLLKFQQKIIKSDIVMPSVNEFNTYYEPGMYSLENLSDGAFSNFHKYLQKLRYRHDLYKEWIDNAGLQNVQLKLVLNVTGYADSAPYACANLLNRCNTNQKSAPDPCNQCLAYLRAQEVTKYLSDNCNFKVTFSTNGVTYDYSRNKNSGFSDAEQRRTTVASIFVLETTNAIDMKGTQEDDLSAIQAAIAAQFIELKSEANCNPTIIHVQNDNANNSSQIKFHTFINTANARKSKEIKKNLMLIAAKVAAPLVDHDIRTPSNQLNICYNDIVFIYFDEQDHFIADVKAMTQKNRLVFIISDVNSEKDIYSNIQQTATGYNPDTTYQQLLRFPKKSINITLKKSMNLLDLLIDVIETKKLNTAAPTFSWANILGAMHKQNNNFEYILEESSENAPPSPYHKRATFSPPEQLNKGERTGHIVPTSTPYKTPKQSFD